MHYRNISLLNIFVLPLILWNNRHLWCVTVILSGACEVEVSISTVNNIIFFNRSRSFDSILFVPHKTALKMTDILNQKSTQILVELFFISDMQKYTIDYYIYSN